MRPAALPQLTALHASTAPDGLVALKISNGALQGKDLPKRIKLLNWGDNETVNVGNVKLGSKTMERFAAKQHELGFDRVALDFNHNSLPSSPNFKPDPREVAGYGVPELVEGDGLYLSDIIYTPCGIKYAPEYIDLSPTPLIEDGEVVFLHSVALCQQGQVRGLTYLSTDFLPLSTSSKNHSTKAMLDYKKLLTTILGCAEDASDEDIQNAAQAMADRMKDKGEKGARIEGATGDNPEKEEPASTDATALSAAITAAVTAAVTPLAKRLDDADRKHLIALATSQGKVIPKSAGKLSNEQLEALLADLPVTVPLSARTPVGLTPLALGENEGLDAAQAAVNKQLGISEERFKKIHGGK